MGDTLFSRMTEDGRIYEWKGKDYVSVTTAIKNGVSKPGLIGWAARTVANLAVEMQSDDNGQPQTLNVKSLMQAFDGARGGAASIGNVVHSIAEKISNNQSVDLNSLGDDVRPYVESFIRFVDEWKPKFIETEAFVASRKHEYAGTLDAIVEFNGKAYILDIKTGKNVYPEVGLQMAAYARADFIGRVDQDEKQLPEINMNKGIVLHIRPDKYDVYPVMIGEQVFETFLSALDMHHCSTSLKHYIVGPKWRLEDEIGQ
jgi:hypothetical protein